MDPAELATQNAIMIEAKKDGLAQRQSGDWMLRLTIAAADMDKRITGAPMGTRYAVALVEITDDETPRDFKSEERDRWRDLGATKQAAIRCKEPVFWAFLTDHMFNGLMHIGTEELAARTVKDHCGILSRADLDKPGNSEARRLWHNLDHEFQAWKVKERVA